MINILIRSSILVIMALGMRKIFEQTVPRRIWVYLWMVVIVRFLFPVNIQIPLLFKRINHQGMEGNTKPIPPLQNLPLFGFLLIVWILGVLCGCIVTGKMIHREMILLKDAISYESIDGKDIVRSLSLTKKKIRIVVTDKVQSPCVCGVIHPVIVLSEDSINKKRIVLSHVITHEIMHIIHYDNLFKMLGMIAVILYWFDPFVWLMFITMSKDIELACDEDVLSHIGREYYNDYVLSLLLIADRKGVLSSFSTGFGKKSLIERVETIMKHRKINPMKAAVATVIIGSLSAVFFVSAKENNISLSSQIHASEVDMISSKQISSAETDLLSSESDSSLEDDLISAEENYSPEHNGISTIVSSVENKSGEETVSDNSSDENLNPWYRKYYPDLTDDDVRKIEAVHEANRRLIAEYESQNHKGR